MISTIEQTCLLSLCCCQHFVYMSFILIFYKNALYKDHVFSSYYYIKKQCELHPNLMDTYHEPFDRNILILHVFYRWPTLQQNASNGHRCSTLQLRQNECDGVSDNQRLDCLLNRLFVRRSKKTWKLRVTGLCEGNPLVTGGFPSQRASRAENVSI